MKYKISHTTRYQYEDTASLSHNELYLTPRETPVQHCIESAINLSPHPAATTRRVDCFGNQVTTTTVQTPHTVFEISAQSQVVINPAPMPLPEETPPWEQVKESVWHHTAPDDLEAFQFVFPSPMIPVSEKFARWASNLFSPETPILKAALGLTEKIFTMFKYDPQATTTNTPVEAAFDIKKGVCQDFAHIEIACLRSLGLPARYV
ncbi:MAG: transglutaminase family protein, partial [Desulfamplus sp.]|nr:transglutaminase family protein [Desulfamplus sp.]